MAHSDFPFPAEYRIAKYNTRFVHILFQLLLINILSWIRESQLNAMHRLVAGGHDCLCHNYDFPYLLKNTMKKSGHRLGLYKHKLCSASLLVTGTFCKSSIFKVNNADSAFHEVTYFYF